MASKNTREVPGIFFVGENDFEARKNIVKGIFAMNRRLGANWTFVQEPNSKHEEGKTKQLVFDFFESVFPLRLDVKINAGKLKTIPEYTGYTGNIESLTYVKSAKDQNSNELTVWLPDSVFAEKWNNFSIKNKVKNDF